MKIENLKLKIDSGFTLIELLIVIALLGALAVGLLATVDPFEQLKKGTDTSRRNTTSELYNAFIRYYALKNDFPWTTDVSAMQASHSDMTSDTDGHIKAVIDVGELKPEFLDLAGSGNLAKIRISSTDSDSDPGVTVRQNVSVCFLPESKSFAAEANSVFGADGQVSTGCKGTGGTTSCYWCIK